MASKNQLTGMQGVYLVASELSRHGLIASPTSRSARGADILVTDQDCERAFSVQVKTNSTGSSYWLLNADAKRITSPTHIYVFVRLKKNAGAPDFFVVPSQVVADEMASSVGANGNWQSFDQEKASRFQDKWNIFETGQ